MQFLLFLPTQANLSEISDAPNIGFPYIWEASKWKIDMKEDNNKKNIIIYNTIDGKASVSLYAKDGTIWMNQEPACRTFRHLSAKYQHTHI